MRRLGAEERALWEKVIATVRPLDGRHPALASATPVADPTPARAPSRPAALPQPARSMGVTLVGGWDKRLSRGLVSPDASVDLHGHGLASAYALLDDRLAQAIHRGDRLLLLVTGKPRADARSGRGAIRAAVGDWLAASPHAGAIAAVRPAHPRHGGAGALYIVLRRRRTGQVTER